MSTIPHETRDTHSFVDTAGKTWSFNFNGYDMKRIDRCFAPYNATVKDKNEAIYILDQVGILTRINEIYFLLDVLWFVLQPQAEKEGITDEDFGRRLAGDVLADAQKAFTAAYVDFFPNALTRSSLRELAEKAREAAEEVRHAVIAKKIEEDPTELMTAIQEALQKQRTKALANVRETFDDSPGNTAASLDSPTRTTTTSANSNGLLSDD